MDRLAARDIAEHAGLSVVVLFGSTARGTAREDSDVDLGVLAAGGRPLDFRQLGAVEVYFSRHYGRDVDVVDLATADALLRFELVSDAVILYAEPRDAWTDLVARTLIDHDDIAPMLPEMIAGVGRAARAGAKQ